MMHHPTRTFSGQALYKLPTFNRKERAKNVFRNQGSRNLSYNIHVMTNLAVYAVQKSYLFHSFRGIDCSNLIKRENYEQSTSIVCIERLVDTFTMPWHLHFPPLQHLHKHIGWKTTGLANTVQAKHGKPHMEETSYFCPRDDDDDDDDDDDGDDDNF